MSTRSPRIGAVGLGLVALCSSLSAVIWLELRQGRTTVRAETSVEAPKPSGTSISVPSATIGFPPLQRYAEIAQRPLFDVSRRPAPPEASESPAAAAAELRQWTLTGVVITPQKKLAILRDKTPGPIVRLEQGRSLGKWSLDEVRRDGVTFRKDSAMHELKLHENKDQAQVAGGGSGRTATGRAQEQNQAQAASGAAGRTAQPQEQDQTQAGDGVADQAETARAPAEDKAQAAAPTHRRTAAARAQEQNQAQAPRVGSYRRGKAPPRSQGMQNND